MGIKKVQAIKFADDYIALFTLQTARSFSVGGSDTAKVYDLLINSLSRNNWCENFHAQPLAVTC